MCVKNIDTQLKVEYEFNTTNKSRYHRDGCCCWCGDHHNFCNVVVSAWCMKKEKSENDAARGNVLDQMREKMNL